MASAVHLAPESVEAIARRVVELSHGEGVSGKLIDASEVARLFNVSRDFVYQHADRLGVVRLGDGPKPLLRFDPMIVRDRLSAAAPHSKETEETPQRRKPRPVRRAPVDLLPVRGDSP